MLFKYLMVILCIYAASACACDDIQQQVRTLSTKVIAHGVSPDDAATLCMQLECLLQGAHGDTIMAAIHEQIPTLPRITETPFDGPTLLSWWNTIHTILISAFTLRIPEPRPAPRVQVPERQEAPWHSLAERAYMEEIGLIDKTPDEDEAPKPMDSDLPTTAPGTPRDPGTVFPEHVDGQWWAQDNAPMDEPASPPANSTTDEDNDQLARSTGRSQPRAIPHTPRSKQ